MHPLLATRGRTLLYLAGWVPILALLDYLMWASGGATWVQNTAVLGPACLLFAFACLSPWPICRVRPLHLADATMLAVTWSAAAAAASAMFAGSALAMARPAPRREPELRALRMQINPHFLFNSLHSIAALATADGGRAREMCIRLADFLRSSLGLGERQSIPLREELALAHAYLEVERVRFGARLQVSEDIQESCQDCAVPVLLLQPLVENAVKHGIAGLVEGGAIRLSVERLGASVLVAVENGFDPDAPPPNRLGMGLPHVRRRLELRYGDASSLEAGGREGVYRVELRFPCESPIASSSRA